MYVTLSCCRFACKLSVVQWHTGSACQDGRPRLSERVALMRFRKQAADLKGNLREEDGRDPPLATPVRVCLCRRRVCVRCEALPRRRRLLGDLQQRQQDSSTLHLTPGAEQCLACQPNQDQDLTFWTSADSQTAPLGRTLSPLAFVLHFELFSMSTYGRGPPPEPAACSARCKPSSRRARKVSAQGWG